MKWGFFKKKQTNYPADQYSKDYINEILEALKDENEITKIPISFSFLLTSSEKLKLRTAKVLLESVSKLNNSHLFKLDKIFRERTSFDWTYDWKNESPKNLLLPTMSEDEKLTILGFCTFHPNGYFREKALHDLDSFSSGKELPYLILRCNDWVREVRETAKKYVESRISIKYVEHLVQNLPLIFQLKNAERDDHSELFEKVVNLLSQKESLPFIDQGTKSEISKIRYFCYKVIIYSKMFNKKMLVNYLKAEREPHSRLLLFNEIINDISQDEFNEYYSILKKDKFPMIRAKILERYYSFYPDQSTCELEKALVDKSGAIRSIARFLLKKQNITNFAPYYEEFIKQKSNVNLRGAILGLGEVGNTEQVKLIIPFIKDNRVGIVKAAIRSIMMIDANKYIDNFIEMLNHEHKGVSKEAMRCLLTTSCANKKDFLDRIYNQSNYEHTKYNAAILLCSLPKWESIQYIIEFYVNKTDSNIYNLGRSQFTNWLANFNRTFDTPSRTQVEAIKKILDQFGNDLEKSEKRHIEFCIKGF
ncbi:hypothetical protein BACCIP111895_00766 [Neobacillus rhizosphaerae]|uniref:HEAT repeat domain-containing protein n=1 Tax=Neobacillus rhizosphaerae TaxID=2880965 RepID=A0ABN8KNE7_9BACI|nr:HEAT repeat domain-containing protein [Neobacillus rhizosphaerae]CAH2713630.1 hypothetical protein BACCIP111895_00766 [Neobacillus rhizosphaerae]